MAEDKGNWYREAIERLLAYPRVGPLSASAIAINLGTEQDQIQDVLDALVKEGRVVRTADARFTVPTVMQPAARS
jgi:hypothetical protein